MTERLVVIGGDAAGMSAASLAKRRRGEKMDVIVVERGDHTSYSACGIPYWVAGDVPELDDLVARSPEEHRANGIDVRMRTTAVGIDLDKREIEVRARDSDKTERIGFDHLMIATGATPRRLPVEGADADGIYGVQTLDDGSALLAALCEGSQPKRAVVVGGGYVGVELAEALVRHGLAVTVVDRAEQPMATLDPDMGAQVHEAMEGMGVEVVTNTGVDAFETDAEGRVRAVVAGDDTFPADLVVLGLGVRPNTDLADDAGLPLGASRGLRTDKRMAVPGHPGIWAGGDCAESFDRVAQTWMHIPLGTHANRHGRVAGTNIGGGYATFPGVVRTAVSKVCALEIARTGLREVDAHEAGFRYVAATIESTTRAGYFPGACPVTVKMLAEQGTGKLLGAQIVGREGAGKRIDICAMALWNEMTVDDLAMVDLSYAPPFSPLWDPVSVAARAVAAKVTR